MSWRRRILAVMLVTALGAPALAQRAPPDAQAGAPDPTRQAVTEQDALRQGRRVEGWISIPDRSAATLEQPQSRRYQTFHERIVPWIGTVVIAATLLGLAAFHAWRGRIRLERPPSGIRILRFGLLERFVHWLTAASFIVLAITGLNYVFGKRLLMPLIGPDAFSEWSHWAKLAHNAFPWPFMIGVLLIIVLWIRDNFPDRYDLEWLRQLGGFLSHTHPPARRFNAGQKLIFWAVALFGLTMAASGIVMLFPFALLDLGGMQLAQYFHAIVAMIMIAVILAHIYIGTLGMEGAIDAMVSGDVDLEWAKEHHPIWLEEIEAARRRQPEVGTGAVAAE
jgi:formate dehydrogenase subunit gamma